MCWLFPYALHDASLLVVEGRVGGHYVEPPTTLGLQTEAARTGHGSDEWCIAAPADSHDHTDNSLRGAGVRDNLVGEENPFGLII